MLQVGPKLLIEHQLETYAEAGVGPVAMVVGYQADEIAEVVGIRAEYIPNNRWSTTNSLYSFLQARDWVDGDLIIANCDILFHPSILARLLSSGGDAFAYDAGSGEGLEHMKVQLLDGELVRMSKSLPPEESCGENVGLLYLKEATVRQLFQIADRLVAEGRSRDWLGVAVQELAGERKLRGVDIAGLPWAEIDFAYDLDRARKEVWPAMQRRPPAGRRWRNRLAIAGVTSLAVLAAFAPANTKTIDDVGAYWRTVAPSGGEETALYEGDKHQVWWLLTPDTAIEADSWPGTVRIESRILVGDPGASVPYRLTIRIDGQDAQWRQYDASAQASVRHGELFASALQHEVVEVGSGRSRIQVEGSAAGDARILIRLRQLEEPFCDDDAPPHGRKLARAMMVPAIPNVSLLLRPTAHDPCGTAR
jgi:L-glutamine-phosphate cytidylyltransferase